MRIFSGKLFVANGAGIIRASNAIGGEVGMLKDEVDEAFPDTSRMRANESSSS